MEMTKKPTAPKPSPAPFSSRAEREALEEALLPPPPPPQRSIAPQYVPTAVPIANATPSSTRSPGAAGGVDVDSFYEQGREGEEAYEDVPIVAASVAAPLPVPPPAAAPAAASRATESRGTSTTQRGTGSEKSESCAKGEEGDDVVVLPEPSTYDPYLHPLPTAPAVPTQDSYLPSAERDVAAAGLRAANVRGGWTSREEEADVARAMRGRGSIQRRADDGVRTANERAARQANRRDEGLTVDEGIHRLDLASGRADAARGERGEDDDVRPYGVARADGTRGYEVKEYETSDYETTEYETTEYKSVYD